MLTEDKEVRLTEEKPEEIAAVAPTATRILPPCALGDNGSAVRMLQRILIANCYLTSASYTSYFNAATKNAVKNFQADHGLTVDGIVGPQTWLRLTDHVFGPCLS